MSPDEDGMSMMPPMMMPSSKPTGDLSNTSDYSNMITMSKSLYWGKNVIILFSGWPGENSLGMYVLSLFLLFLLAVAVEILSVGPTMKSTVSPLVSGVTQAGVYALRTALAYLVMLSVMSFNVGILVAVVAGHTLGFFVLKVRALNQLAGANESTVPLKV